VFFSIDSKKKRKKREDSKFYTNVTSFEGFQSPEVSEKKFNKTHQISILG
jgi:hypothetical protein